MSWVLMSVEFEFEIGCQPGGGSCASFYDPTPPFCCGADTLTLLKTKTHTALHPPTLNQGKQLRFFVISNVIVNRSLFHTYC